MSLATTPMSWCLANPLPPVKSGADICTHTTLSFCVCGDGQNDSRLSYPPPSPNLGSPSPPCLPAVELMPQRRGPGWDGARSCWRSAGGRKARSASGGEKERGTRMGTAGIVDLSLSAPPSFGTSWQVLTCQKPADYRFPNLESRRRRFVTNWISGAVLLGIDPS
jgi:hypothetical protein